MTAIAVAFVIVAFMAAVAYAAPKFYWYYLQSQMAHVQAADEKERFEALKESHDLTTGLQLPEETDTTNKLGPYL